MKITPILRDTKGATSIEFALTAIPFMLIVFGLLQCGLWIWTQFALQHAAEMAARCASINSTLCGTTGAVQNYAAQQALGMNVQASIFSVTQASCGNQVAAHYIFPSFAPSLGLPSVTLAAQACFPTSS